nr:TetR/AcrR family transcriptional regulator [uncultured Bdellovibrio sp.]
MKKRGRPKGKTLLTIEDICSASLKILDESGSKGLSMRTLADALGVTPMALYNHVEDRVSLLRALSDYVYRDVSQKFKQSTGSPRKRTEFLLINYYAAVLKHPNLSLSIFEAPDAFSIEAARITNYLEALLKDAGLSLAKRKLWLEILVDFTHGSSIATATHQTKKKSDRAFIQSQSQRYEKALAELLNHVFP